MRLATLSRNRDFTRLWAGQALSKLGSRGSALAVPLLVLHLTGSVAAAGTVAFLDAVADLVVTLPGGAFADRHDRRTVMLVCDVGGALALATLATAVLTGHATLAVVIGACILDSVFGSVFGSASAATLPSVVRESEMPDAISLIQARNAAVHLAGPVLGGLLFVVHPALPFAVDAVSYLASALCTAYLRASLQVEVAAERTFRGDLVAGLRFLLGHPVLRHAMVNAAVLNSAFGGIVLAVIAVSQQAGASGGTIGLVVAMSSLGSLVGAMFAPWVSRSWGVRRSLLSLLTVVAVLVPAMALSPGPVVLGALLAGCALLAPVLNTVVFGLLVGLTPDGLQGRVQSSVAFAALALGPIGPLAAGLALDRVGASGTFLGFGAVLALLAAWTFATRSRLGDGPRRGRHRAPSHRDASHRDPSHRTPRSPRLAALSAPFRGLSGVRSRYEARREVKTPGRSAARRAPAQVGPG